MKLSLSRTRPVLVALLLTVPILAVITPAGANTEAILGAIEASGENPGKDFTFVPEYTRFYFNGDNVTNENLAPNPGVPGVGNDPILGMDTQFPTPSGDLPIGPTTAVVAGGAVQTLVLGEASVAIEVPRFDLVFPVADVTTIYEVDATVFVSGIGLPEDLVLPDEIRMRVYKVSADGTRDSSHFVQVNLQPGSASITNPATVNPGPVRMFTGSSTVGGNSSVEGFVLQPGEKLSADLQLTNGVGLINLNSGAFPSHIGVRSDSARIVVWTKDRDGDNTNVFKRASTASVGDRLIDINAAHFNVWGNEDCPDGPDANDCPHDNLDQNKHRIRIRQMIEDEATGILVPGNLLDMDQGGIAPGSTAGGRVTDVVRCCGDNANTIQYTPVRKSAAVFQYDFRYASSLPDGVYRIELHQPDNNVNDWVVNHIFRIGLSDFAIEPAPGEPVTDGTIIHQVLPGEETHYTIRVSNLGVGRDTISISAPLPAASGWTTRLSSTSVSLAAGESTDVTLIVKSPGFAVQGDSLPVTVSAVSAVDNQLKTVSTRTEVVNTDVPGVEITSVLPQLEIRPAQEKAFALTVRNTGFARSGYVIGATLSSDDLGSNCEDWSLRATPPSLSLPSSSRQDLAVTIFAPVDTLPGTTCIAAFTAERVGDASVADQLILPVVVQIVDALTVLLKDDGQHALRGPGAPVCKTGVDTTVQCTEGDFIGTGVPDYASLYDEDNADDQTVVQRIVISNDGDRTDTFTMVGNWAIASGQDRTRCAGEGPGLRDGVPDGWGFSYPATGSVPLRPVYGSGAGLSSSVDLAFAGTYELDSFTLAPGEVAITHIEIGYADDGYVTSGGYTIGDDVCTGTGHGGNQDASPNGAFEVHVRSQNDPTVASSSVISLERTSAGEKLGENRYTGAVHNVDLEFEPQVEDVQFIQPGGTATYRMRATSQGNDLGAMTIRVDPGYEGWTHEIVLNSTVPPEIPCTLQTSLSHSCTAVGSHDEMVFDVIITPPPNVPIGTRHGFSVEAAVNGFEGPIVASQRLTTRVAGLLDFETGTDHGSVDVPIGETALIPFTIANTGTAGDTFSLRTINPGNVATVDAWMPQLSRSSLFVPGLREAHGFLEVKAPESATVGQAVNFQVFVQSAGNQASQVISLFGTAVEAPENFAILGDPVGNLVRAGESVDVKLVVTDTTGATEVDVFAEGGLPDGWSITPTSHEAVPIVDNLAEIMFTVQSPADALGISRLPLRFRAEAGGQVAYTDLIINLASVYGVSLATPEESFKLLAPGSQAGFTIEVTNTGLTDDTILVEDNVVGLPAGWFATVDPPAIPLGPLESRDAIVNIHAPSREDAPAGGPAPGDLVSLQVFASSLAEPTRGDSVGIQASLGSHVLEMSAVPDEALGAPEETVTYTLSLRNNGTLPLKAVELTGIPSVVHANGVLPEFNDPVIVELLPNATIERTVSFDLPGSARGEDLVPVTVRANSTDPVLQENGFASSLALAARILNFVSHDVDRDGVNEFVVDANDDLDDGFEDFREAGGGAGIQTVCLSCPTASGEPLLARFLTDAGRDAKTRTIVQADDSEVELFVYDLDGDDDGRADLLLDTIGDELPDTYMDPDPTGFVLQDLNVAYWQGVPVALPKDVTGDGVLDYFIDLDGDGLRADGSFDFSRQSGRLDAFFDVTTGEFGDLLPIDLNDDGIFDYVVDLDGDGEADTGEPVIYAERGRIVSLQLADVDGDGVLDEVYTFDGRGPNCFIPRGTNLPAVITPGTCIPIVLRDVTGDGVDDWTYDYDGKGGVESYYDPVEQEAGVIDQDELFLENLVKYWWVLVLFALVTVLFVVLVAVTRRR
ncbi:MAG: hypothetical protein ACPGQL_01570 [Thermoplasmatota archaeon]